VVLDLSQEPPGATGAVELEQWHLTTGFRFLGVRIAVLHPGPGERSLAAWWRAVGEARRQRRHMLVLLGLVPAINEAVPALIAQLLTDPMLGTAQPRFADPATDRLWPLPPYEGPVEGISRACLPRLPESVITAELLACCMVIRREVVAAMEPPQNVSSSVGALMCELIRARRRGFRNVVANRVVVPCNLDPGELYPGLTAADDERVREYFPDAEIATGENRELFARQLEPLLSVAYPGEDKRRLLLDCRGLAALHNGTSQCVLGVLDALAELRPDWAIHVQSSPEASTFHDLPGRYPMLTHHLGPLSGAYAAILLLNQPWSMEHIAELHRHALLIGFNILDTIGWDILYVGPAKLDRTWRFTSRHSDILTFISDYSRERFRRRFPLAPRVRDEVVYLSLAADEQRIEDVLDAPIGDHVVLFGNAYAHKGLQPAIRLLASAFPFHRFVAFGTTGRTPPNVRALPSGATDATELHRLVATARAIVYPSFYEGFGLPVLEGLAYGRPVLVRTSPLWAEIAAHSRFEGRLIEFEDDTALIERLGNLLAGQDVASLPFGAALIPEEQPFRWRDAAAALLRLVDEQLRTADTSHWQARAECLRLAGL
jgi:glycosyltransferase involved in cell wall biosynthesis